LETDDLIGVTHVKAKVIFTFGNRCVYLLPTNHVSMIRRVP
jgi:hypothetical protein